MGLEVEGAWSVCGNASTDAAPPREECNRHLEPVIGSRESPDAGNRAQRSKCLTLNHLSSLSGIFYVKRKRRVQQRLRGNKTVYKDLGESRTLTECKCASKIHIPFTRKTRTLRLSMCRKRDRRGDGSIERNMPDQER